MSKDRNFGYASKATTAIWHEQPTSHNPYVAESARLHGYDIVELSQKKGFVDVLLLMFTGELPSPAQAELLNALMVSLISPGPRHPATRAAMTAGISKTNNPHLLPIGLMAMGGARNGAQAVEDAMHFIHKHQNQSAQVLIETVPAADPDSESGEQAPYPGIGSTYGSADVHSNRIAQTLGELPASGQAMQWMAAVIAQLDHPQIGWLPMGIAAAVLTDLGIPPREGGGLYQLISAPGLLAHAMEQTHKPIRSMPFLDDDDYEFSTTED